MPRYDDGDSKNPDGISWFKDNPYDNGDSKNPDNFSWFEDTPTSAVDEEGYYDHLCFLDHPTFPIMEPDDNDPPPPTNNYRGIMGGPPPENVPPPDVASHAGSSRSHRSSSQSSLSTSLHNNPPSQRSQPTNYIVLCISPASGSATFGYIYLAETKLHHQDAISACFNSAGREISVIPCPDLDTFIINLNLMYCDVMFASDLPRYIIPTGNRILQANQYIMIPPTMSGFPLPPTSPASTPHLGQQAIYKRLLNGLAAFFLIATTIHSIAPILMELTPPVIGHGIMVGNIAC
jgi:hypothetical protein